MKGVSVPDWLCFVRPSDRTLRFSATTLGASMLSTLFYTYYIPLFLKSWGLTYGWFYAGQTLFMVWNAVNDPLFGWIQDNPSAPRQDNIRTYSRAIYLGGPLFALATLLPWWPWVEPFSSPAITGLHFIVSLFLFDGLFTYVVLAQCGLFADIEGWLYKLFEIRRRFVQICCWVNCRVPRRKVRCRSDVSICANDWVIDHVH